MSTRRFLLISFCAAVTGTALFLSYQHWTHSRSINSHVTNTGVAIPAAARALRPNYPYSVVPGGVYSPAELETAYEKDSLVRQHYADFHVRSARLVKLTDDRYEYVSFRLGNRVFWTRNKLRIPSGEVLLTDGYNYARTRCGNRLSDLPMANTTPLQPVDRLLDLPSFSPALLPELSFVIDTPVTEPQLLQSGPSRLTPLLSFNITPAVNAPENWPPLHQPLPITAVTTPPYISAPTIPSHPSSSPYPPLPSPINPAPTTPPTSPVPEPGTLALFGVGVAVSLLFAVNRGRC